MSGGSLASGPGALDLPGPLSLAYEIRLEQLLASPAVYCLTSAAKNLNRCHPLVETSATPAQVRDDARLLVAGPDDTIVPGGGAPWTSLINP